MPRAEDDTSVRGLPQGVEGEQAAFVEGTGGPASGPAIRPVQIPVDFSQPNVPPPVVDDPPEGPDESLDTAFGNMGDYLFSPTERPEESFDTPLVPEAEPKASPIDLYRALLFSSSTSSETKEWAEMMMRLMLIGGGRG